MRIGTYLGVNRQVIAMAIVLHRAEIRYPDVSAMSLMETGTTMKKITTSRTQCFGAKPQPHAFGLNCRGHVTGAVTAAHAATAEPAGAVRRAATYPPSCAPAERVEGVLNRVVSADI